MFPSFLLSIFLWIQFFGHYNQIIIIIRYTEISTIINQMSGDYQPLSHQVEPQQVQSVTVKQGTLFDGLNQIKVWAYGLGHFFNDLAGACWFNFLFYYLKRVVETPSATAMIVFGQIADGIATPTIGYFSDKFNSKYGKRIPWYIGGLIILTGSFLSLYQNFRSENKAYEYLYYCTVSVLANLGWAAVQISHMSLVPELTCSRKRRDRLNNLRNTFNFVANFLTLGLGLIIFEFMANPPLEYAIISYTLAMLGVSASIFFLLNIKEVPLAEQCRSKAKAIKKMLESENKRQIIVVGSSSANTVEQKSEQLEKDEKIDTIVSWFKMPKFYLFGICYMGARLTGNMFGTFLPFYLIGVLKLGINDQQDQNIIPFTVALVPLIVYISSVVSSSGLNMFYTKFGRKKALSCGALLCSISLLSLLFVDDQNSWIVYIVSVFIGLSQPMILSTSINFISDVIGRKSKSGAFIFGAYSLVDKFSAGLVIFLIGNSSAYTTKPKQLSQYQKSFIKYTFLLIPCLSCTLASLIVMGYPIKEYSKNKVNEDEAENNRNKIEQQFVQ